MAGALLLAACNNADTSGTASKSDSSANAMNDQESKEERNKKIVKESVEAFMAHDADAVLKDADPNTVDYGDGSFPAVKGLDSVKAGIKMWLTTMPDAKGEDLKYVADGDWVMVWGKWTGTWKGDFMGQKATGKSYKIYDVDIFKLSDDGKILEHHSVQSPMTTAYQVGMKMPK